MSQEARKILRQNTNSGYSLRTHAHMHRGEEEKRRERAKTGRINEEGGKHQVEGVAAAVVATGEVRDRFLGGRSSLRLSPRLGGLRASELAPQRRRTGKLRARCLPSADCMVG